SGPDESLRRAMTFETPFHLQRCRLVSNRHLVNPAVTGCATYPFVYVNAVIEIGVIRQIVYADPFDWFAGAKARAHRFQIRAVCPNLLVTIHASVSRRKSCGS